MTNPHFTTRAALGFLTVMNDPARGLFGGYLILNPAGRPVEFHCTAPVKPNRAQQILYGPTLEPFLYGEQIAKTLIEKSKFLPRAICVDQPSILCVRPLVEVPVLYVKETQASAPAAEHEFTWRHHLLTAAANQPGDVAAMRESLAELLIDFDLLEPFERIREAISEAQKAC